MVGEDGFHLSCVSALERTVGMAHFEPVGDEVLICYPLPSRIRCDT